MRSLRIFPLPKSSGLIEAAEGSAAIAGSTLFPLPKSSGLIEAA